MRLRRMIAIGAAAGAVVLATTAAVLPASPVDRPQPLPAFTAKALTARYATDSRMIEKAARAIRRESSA